MSINAAMVPATAVQAEYEFVRQRAAGGASLADVATRLEILRQISAKAIQFGVSEFEVPKPPRLSQRIGKGWSG